MPNNLDIDSVNLLKIQGLISQSKTKVKNKKNTSKTW